ncbi:hypothetical protein AB6A40_004180 [Gnathostoma spinigerum]|uniref:[heparan sulfate]-glucosamine N-sulfotransferase n=1 Tax=Gnathostoma spinigerum TaxID=75299 RepID=A0ABD6EJ85_9BILA
MFWIVRRHITYVLRWLLAVTVLSFFVFSYLYQQSSNSPSFKEQSVRFTIPQFVCPLRQSLAYSNNSLIPVVPVLKVPLKTERKVLVFVESVYSAQCKQIINILDALRVPRKVETLSKNLPLLTTTSHGRFSLIIIENYQKYLNLPMWNRELLDKYCRDYGVGIIAFLRTRSEDSAQMGLKHTIPVSNGKQRVLSLRLSAASPINLIGKTEVTSNLTNITDDWVVFSTAKGYQPVVSTDEDKKAAVIFDEGYRDGIRRVLFGQIFTHWMIKLAFVDSLRYLSKLSMNIDLDRYIQVDVDDIFVGVSGGRMQRHDVKALVACQNRLRRSISNFSFTLGFSGYYFRSGNDLEDRGDESLIEMGSNFLWFPHMWRHNHANEYNLTYLEAIMYQNKLFAKTMNLSLVPHYSVSPLHAGVYPAHEALYKAWKSVWNIKVTSTEEYPHLRPSWARRGFVHMNISVLPRQTCGLYTRTQFFHSYPDGFQRLLNNIEGGDLFFTVVLNPFNIFMTHQQNFGNDRLGIFTFERLVEFISCWTNLKLQWISPMQMAEKYFLRFPAERLPVWSNPCSDPRHMHILPSAFNCSEMLLPNLLVVGPQKTGSTALRTFLLLHPNISSNDIVPNSFEELQFFGGSNYANGILWYMNQFRRSASSEKLILFEKSATYFDAADAPRTAAALIPGATIIMILIDPSVRAYSWYQHMRAHNDTTALNYSLDDIVAANSTSPYALRKLRRRCITPGRYSHHMEHWLEYYPLSQIIVVDGELLRSNPVSVLNNLLDYLHLPSYNYGAYLRFDTKKGFFCVNYNGTKKCLGSSKGRTYAPMSNATKARLDRVFLEDNVALHKLLVRNHLVVPTWLRRLLT